MKPFRFWEIRRLLKEYGLESEEEIVKVYSMLGGMPRYYDTMNRLGLDLNKKIGDRVLHHEGIPRLERGKG